MASTSAGSRRATGSSACHVGVDVGATLTKLAHRPADATPEAGRTEFELLPSENPAAVVKRVEALAPASVGLTGAGAAPLSEQLQRPSRRFDEFEAWGGGASRMLAEDALGIEGPYLLVSLGTGTSMLHVEGERITRVAGSALGGGTVMGLGEALLGEPDFAVLCRMAAEGIEHRGQVDLLVGDIYRPGEIELPPHLNASSFAKLAREAVPGQPSGASREALAASCMALVGENIGWIAGWRALSLDTEHILFAGSTLRQNPVLEAVLLGVAAGAGRRGHVLRSGEFAGALGALELAA